MQIYIGSITSPKIKDKIENAKLILSIGSLKSDFNTGNFTYKIPVSNTVEVSIIIHILRFLALIVIFTAIAPFRLHPNQICHLSRYRNETPAPQAR